LLHYYYDGFIWKVRHKENRENLAMDEDKSKPVATVMSWWDGRRRSGALGTFFKQCLYFGVPILFLAVTWYLTRADSRGQPIAQLTAMMEMHRSGRTNEVMRAASGALAVAERQLETEERMNAICPQAKHYTYIGHLCYLKAQLARLMLGSGGPEHALTIYREEMGKAIGALEQALRHPAPYGHRELPELTRKDVEAMLAQWQQHEAERLAPTPQVLSLPAVRKKS
jgi:hypothetical protein